VPAKVAAERAVVRQRVHSNAAAIEDVQPQSHDAGVPRRLIFTAGQPEGQHGDAAQPCRMLAQGSQQ